VQRGSQKQQGQRTHKKLTWEQMWILRLEEPEEQQKAQTSTIIREEKMERVRKMLMWLSATTANLLALAYVLEHPALDRRRGQREKVREEKSCGREGKSLRVGWCPAVLTGRQGAHDRLHLPWLVLVASRTAELWLLYDTTFAR